MTLFNSSVFLSISWIEHHSSPLWRLQVDQGVPYLCQVLKEVNEQRQSKTWYLLRAQVLQTCCSYLSLDTAALPQAERSRLAQHGESKHLSCTTTC